MPRCSGASARFFSATSGLVLTATFGRTAELFDFADGASKVDRKQMEETSNLACSYTNRLSFVSRLARMFAHLETFASARHCRGGQKERRRRRGRCSRHGEVDKSTYAAPS
jgi:hypothetical protein